MLTGPSSTSKRLKRGPWIAISGAMRRLILLLSLLLPALAADPFTAQVVRVIDGDTITVAAPGHIFKVRAC